MTDYWQRLPDALRRLRDTSKTWLLAIVLLATLAACGPDPVQHELPAIPDFAGRGLQPAIHEQIKAADQALRNSPDDAEANGRLGMLYHTYGQLELASPLYARARLLDPAEHRWAHYHGIVLARRGDAPAAIDAFRNVLAMRPDDVTAQLHLAQVLTDDGQIDESRDLYEAIVTRNPEQAGAHYGLGRLFARAGNPERAIVHLARAIELGGNFDQAHYALALAYRAAGDAERAGEHMALYEQYRDTLQPSHDDLAVDLRNLSLAGSVTLKSAQSLLAQGRTAEAIEVFERTLRVDPQSVAAHASLVGVYGTLGRIDEAKRHYRLGTESAPGHVDLHFNMGGVWMKAGRHADAVAAYQRVLERNPDHAAAHAHLGLAHEKQGLAAAATGHYRRALASEPGNRQAAFLLGRLLASQGQFEPAIVHLQRSLLPEDEKTPVYLHMLAKVYANTGRYEESHAAFDSALRLARAHANSELVRLLKLDQEKLAPLLQRAGR